VHHPLALVKVPFQSQVSFQQLGDDLSLTGELCPEAQNLGLQPLEGSISVPFEGGSSVLKELLLPAIEGARLQLELVAESRHRHFLKQTALHGRAKGEPAFCFYALYDKVYREDVLAHAYGRCRANRGAPGVDVESFAAIESAGLERWLADLARELKEKAYRREAVKRVWIPKPNGKVRPLGIPTIRDRVVQQALLLAVGPIFEADLQDEQLAYRPDRSALDAVQAVHRWVEAGHTAFALQDGAVAV